MAWLIAEVSNGILLGVAVVFGFVIPRMLLRTWGVNDPKSWTWGSIVGIAISAFLLCMLRNSMGPPAFISASVAFFFAWRFDSND